MLGYKHFYTGVTKKVVAIFGSIFNDLYVEKRVKQPGEKELSSTYYRVPLSYANRSRILRHFTETDGGIQVRFPRMSFQINDFSIQQESRLNKYNSQRFTVDGREYQAFQAIPLVLNLELAIISNLQDDCLQIFEQILPFFNPTYTVSVKNLEYEGSRTDVPITLTDISYDDSYEGGLEDGQRVVQYIMTFSIVMNYSGAWGRYAYNDLTGRPGEVPGSSSPSGDAHHPANSGKGGGPLLRDVTGSLIKAVELEFESSPDDLEKEYVVVRTKYRDSKEEDNDPIETEYQDTGVFDPDYDVAPDLWDPREETNIKHKHNDKEK